jgi:proteic killer suppression protein
MIRGFAHKGLERFYRTGSKSGIQAQQAKRLRLILTNLDQAESSGGYGFARSRVARTQGQA